jgi:hypothetical protein
MGNTIPFLIFYKKYVIIYIESKKGEKFVKVIIAGGRDFDNYEYLSEVMNSLDFIVTEVVCGGARGADSLGEKWAKTNGVQLKYFYPNWDGLGKAVGHIRNREMAEYGDYLVAFWDGKSKGTQNMIMTMQQLGKHGTVVFYERD